MGRGVTVKGRTLTLEGRGLHSGQSCRVELRREPGPVSLAVGGTLARVAELAVVRADHGVQVSLGPNGPRIELVEHLFAALGGLGIHTGLRIAVLGPELPLLDGGARAWTEALRRLELQSTPAPTSIRKAGQVRVDDSRYEFVPHRHPMLEVTIDFVAPNIGRQSARWDGSAEGFATRVAPCRTFGFARDHDRLRRSGRAAHVDPGSVMVLDDSGRVMAPGEPARAQEFAGHKLLDLIGDLYLFGGPPQGVLRAFRPGHASTQRALREALGRGLFG